MNKLIILLTAMLIFASVSGIGTAIEIHVPQERSSIQAAVYSAISGDVIIVAPGTYNESIKINTPNLIIKSESGSPENTIIKTINSKGFNVTANKTTISGFKIESGETGIGLFECSGCSITNNDLSNNKIGISLSRSNYSTISGNRADLNSLHGIQLVNSEGNNISYNNVNSNSRGINSIISNKNQIVGNSASNNSAFGMWISQSHDNIISGNTVNESGGGIHFNSSSRNTLSENIVAFNIGSGFFECPGCHYNRVYNNYVNNVYNANINTRDTTWYRAKTAGRNIVGGPYLGGNFWGTPAGTGFSETAQDNDGDGIADTEYNVSNITDKLPLISGKSNLPVANFNVNPMRGNAPLSVQFTDLSLNTAGRNWDFGDGNYSIEQNPTHIYTAPGTYTVSLAAVNPNGSTSKFATINVGQIPVANFSSNPTSGYAPLTVQFTDLSQNAVSWNWDFDYNEATSHEQSPNYTYEVPGNYTVTLTAGNGNGTNSTTQEIIVQKYVVLPVADFSANVTSGYAPLAVQFTDLSQNSIGRGWDFTNDWQGDSGEAAPVYVFTTPGTYNVNLVAINENGTAAKTAAITVLQKSSSSGGSSSGGSSSGGSGGAGGSPEPAKNVKVKELSQTFIKSGSPVKFDLAKNATSIVYLNFDSKKTVGKTTTIVEMLKNKSTLTPDAPAGEVYNYMNIWVGNGGYGSDEDNLENAVICFKVEKSWLQEKGIDQSSISLNRYNDKKWSELPTTLLREDNKYLYFTAETPGFSPFAITGNVAAKESGTEIQPETGGSKENTGSTPEDLEQQPGKEDNTSTPEKESNGTGIPGFEMIYGIAGLLTVFLHKRK